MFIQQRHFENKEGKKKSIKAIRLSTILTLKKIWPTTQEDQPQQQNKNEPKQQNFKNIKKDKKEED